MARVFFSYYAPSDAESVGRIAGDLRRQGVDLWYKEDLKAGRTWMPQIQTALSGAHFMLVFVSQNSLKGNFSKRVFEIALQSQARARGPRTVAVLLERVDLPPSLAKVPSADFSRSHAEGMRQLSQALEGPARPRPGKPVDYVEFAHRVAPIVAAMLGSEPDLKTYPTPRQTDPKLVFAIMAFHKDMEPIFEGIRDAGASHGLTVQRVKDVQGDYRITDKIIELISTARFVVADLTLERPNVYFELGYARGLGKRVITIAREGASIHFDVKDWAYIPYSDSRTLERDLKDRFEFELSSG